MPYKYIGRTHSFKGKTLWEILGNLKNFGVGRIIARSKWERYPEPSYYKILNVEPILSPETVTYDDRRIVKAAVERTFRGKTFTEPVYLKLSTYKTDYKLIPKDEEQEYCTKNLGEKPVKILPKYSELPPLLKELVIRDNKQSNNGENSEEEPKMEIVYQNQTLGKYIIAEEGQTPTIQVTVGMGKQLPKISLYENVVI